MSEATTCPRHPDVETRLSCSACEEPICPHCAREAAVGYKCPDCARHDEGVQPRAGGGASPLSRLFGERGGSSERSAGAGDAESPTGGGGAPATFELLARATAVGVGAAVAAGLLMAPVLAYGGFFLVSAGVLGWLAARAVYWATEERNSTYIRALAMSVAALLVLVGHLDPMGVTGADASSDLAFLAYPAALYGGWIVVRQR